MTCSTCTFFVRFRTETEPYKEKDGFCNRYPTQTKTLANYFCGEYIPSQTQNHTGNLESGYTKIQKALENEKHLLRVNAALNRQAAPATDDGNEH